MAFDLERIGRELAAAPIATPIVWELAVAILNDCLRMAGATPISQAAWLEVLTTRDRREEQAGMLAHILATTSMRDETVAAIRACQEPIDARARIDRFFTAIEPLTAEMIRANAFRQEECVRRWIEIWGGEVAGEGAAESAARLEQLDYRKALTEYERAEKARKREADKRAQALREAEEREAAARGWRE